MLLTLAAVLSFPVMGCSAITDFDEPKDGGTAGALYSINNNLSSVVTVSLMGNTGELSLTLTNPLPQADENTLIAMLEEGTIGLNVQNNVTSINFDLVEGNYSPSLSVPGDYNMSLSPDRLELIINFFNEIQGTSLHAGGDYTATIDVLANDIFVVEMFTREVSVTGG
jgi:hypothetical protein